MNLFLYRAFATELLKIAQEKDPQKNEVLDPDVRALRAERDGREYLQGGRLRSNSQLDTNWVPKIAARSSKRTQYSLDPSINPLSQLNRGDDDQDMSGYGQSRRYVMSGLGGALTGSGAMRASEYISRRIPVEHANRALAKGVENIKWTPYKQGTHLVGAAAGAGLALGDRYLRERRRRRLAEELSKQAMVQKFTPARALKAGQETHKLHDQQIHEGSTRDAPGLLGKKFRIA